MSTSSIINLVDFFDNAIASMLVTVFPMLWLNAVYFLVFWSLFKEHRADRESSSSGDSRLETMTESSGATVIPAGQHCCQYERHFGIVSYLSINHSDISLTLRISITFDELTTLDMRAADIIASSNVSVSAPKITAALAASAAASELKKKVCTWVVVFWQ